MRIMPMSYRNLDRDPPAPPVTWHKARLIDGSRSFLYRDRYGVMQHAGPGDEVVIDGDTLQVRRRDCELL